MKINKIFCLCLALLCLLCGCNTEDVPQSSEETETLETREFSFSVGNISLSQKDKEAEVSVSVKNNPGFLTMAVDIQYDSTAMSLTGISNGESFGDYNFIPPKNTASGCTACWFSSDVPETVEDGEILVLTFAIEENADPGSYAITLSDPQDGGNMDGEENILNFGDAVGYITIE